MNLLKGALAGKKKSRKKVLVIVLLVVVLLFSVLKAPETKEKNETIAQVSVGNSSMSPIDESGSKVFMIRLLNSQGEEVSLDASNTASIGSSYMESSEWPYVLKEADFPCTLTILGNPKIVTYFQMLGIEETQYASDASIIRLSIEKKAEMGTLETLEFDYEDVTFYWCIQVG